MTKFQRIYNDMKEGALLRAGGEAASFAFNAAPEANRKYRLFFAGESAISKFWKNEPDFQWQYHTVTDALDTTHAGKSQYCLDFSSKTPAEYTRRAYRKVAWPPSLSYLWSPPTDDLRLGIRLRSENLALEPGGFLRMLFEVRLRKDGVNPDSVALPPDLVFAIDLAQNTGGKWIELSKACKVPANDVAHIAVLVEGARYSGDVFVEKPSLETALGWNLLPDFSVPVPDKQQFDWTAQYLSRKEWPRFHVELNGAVVFEGEVFERCHTNSEWELPLPAGALLADNELKVRLVSDYHDALPYALHEVGLVSEPAGCAVLVAAAKIAPAGGMARLLFETEEDDVDVTVSSPDPRLTGGVFHFEKAGLHGVRLACGEPGAHIPFEVDCGGKKTVGEIERIVFRANDGVATGTGDMVYVHQDPDSFREYLKWYLENEVGDLVTARPTYRWSGSRQLDAESWRDFARVLNELGMEYVHMWDGRELPGQNTNPDVALFSGPGFRGGQTHERDGACFYWGVRASNRSKFLQQLWEMQQRVYDEDAPHVNPQYCHENYFQIDGEMYWHRHPVTPPDTRLAHDRQIAHLAEIRKDAATRHTGPTVMFKYFFEAGYKWVGYESMYGAIELYMAFLRGAARFGGVARPGVHHAMQWSSSPYDVPEHVRRYRLALYSAYIQGACEINTEEGLWHIEEYYAGFNRFGETCQNHLRQQQDFFRYVRTHSRPGTFRTPLALLHGRFDGWHGFGLRHPWGIQEVESTDAEKSWGLLKVFYPLATPGKPAYCHYCPDDYEVGFFTGTPHGGIDVIPVEAGAGQLCGYGALAFVGYNCAEAADLDRLLKAVRGGGKLLLTRAHLANTTSYADIAAGRLAEIGHPLGFACGAPRLRQSTVKGHPVAVCENIQTPQAILAVTDDGLPLVCRYACGKGEVILVNALAYPAAPALRDLYEEQLRALLKGETEREPVWCACGDDVEFAVYAQDDGSSHVYFLATDWYRDPVPLRHATLRAGDRTYDVAFPFGTLVKAAVRGGTAVWPHSEEAEVLALADSSATVQGYGKCTFTIARGGAVRDLTLDFADAPVKEIAL